MIHPKKWHIYLAIFVFGLLMTVFLILILKKQAVDISEFKNKQIEQVKEESREKVDSLIIVSDSTIKIQKHQIESLAKKSVEIKTKALIENRKLIKKYEAELTEVDNIADSDIDSIHKECRARHRFLVGE